MFGMTVRDETLVKISAMLERRGIVDRNSELAHAMVGVCHDLIKEAWKLGKIHGMEISMDRFTAWWSGIMTREN